MTDTKLLDGLIGEELYFYGVDNNQFKLNNTTYEAIEDESDGYRSYLDSVVVGEEALTSFVNAKGIFYDAPIATVKVIEAPTDATTTTYARSHYDFDGYQLVDVEDGHVWLAIGTDNVDDYYPSFTFYYTPKKPKEDES